MNKNEVAGRVDQLKGTAKRKLGELTDNPRLEGEGMVDQVTGKVRETAGKVERKVDEAIDDAEEAAEDEHV